MIRAILDAISLWAIPVLLVGIPLIGIIRKVKVYDVFVDGAKEGFGLEAVWDVLASGRRAPTLRITEARQASNDGSDAMGRELELLLPLSLCSKRKAVEREQSGLPATYLRSQDGK